MNIRNLWLLLIICCLVFLAAGKCPTNNSGSSPSGGSTPVAMVDCSSIKEETRCTGAVDKTTGQACFFVKTSTTPVKSVCVPNRNYCYEFNSDSNLKGQNDLIQAVCDAAPSIGAPCVYNPKGKFCGGDCNPPTKGTINGSVLDCKKATTSDGKFCDTPPPGLGYSATIVRYYCEANTSAKAGDTCLVGNTFKDCPETETGGDASAACMKVVFGAGNPVCIWGNT